MPVLVQDISVTNTTDEQDQNSSGNPDRDALVDALRQENRLLRALLSPSVDTPDTVQDITGRLHSIANRTYLNLVRRKPWGAFRYDWDAPTDTEYAHRSEAFDRVLHVFHRQWLGIRAAAGSLPGMKLAIDDRGKLGVADITASAATIASRRVSRIVIHGTSPNMVELVRKLAARGLAQSIFIVYHGNITQWCSEQERQFVFSAIDLVRSGSARKLHFMKAGNDIPGLPSSRQLLLNMSPVVPHHYAQATRSSNYVLVPGTPGWRKNLFCNALGAAMAPEVERVLHFARDLALPEPFRSKLERIEYVDRRTTLRLMASCIATLYVSVVECHPMVNLESEAVGTPCLRNSLFLDALEDHEYVRLVEVSDFANPAEVCERLQRVTSVKRTEMVDLIRDYLSQLNTTAMQRYADFLEL